MDVAGHVQVEGLGAREAVTLWTTLMDEKGIQFSSHAHYQADVSGSVDVWRHRSQGGRYQGVFPQGLVSTLAPAPPACQQDVKFKWARLYKRRVEEPFTYQVRVLRGHLTEKELYSGSRPETLASVHFTRDCMGPGVTRHEVEHGNICGTLFLPPGQGPHPLVLDMFGSQAGRTEYRASMLASKGYASLWLPYFAFKHLPNNVTTLHMDYFLEALDYLQNVPKGNRGRVGVVGSSKGAEIAIVLAGLSRDVKAVVGINSYNLSIDSNYVFRGKSYLKGFKLTKESFYVNKGRDGIQYAWGKDDFFHWDHPLILPIEKKAADCLVLLVAGDQDGSLAHRSAITLSERARRLDCGNVYTLILPGTGHIIDPPYHSTHRTLWVTSNLVRDHVSSDYMSSTRHHYGGEAWWTARGATDMWERAREVLHLKLVQEAGLPHDTAC
ncbi:acyl-coenzyme A thioesterase 5-like isoform X2 [Panulirus ornatus]